MAFEEIRCPLCNCASYELLHAVWDRLEAVQDQAQRGTFHIVACAGCGFFYLNPRPRQEDLASYYRAEKYDPHRHQGGGIIGFLYRLLRPLSVGWKAAAVSPSKRSGRLLDIGCGSGEFLAEMRRRGWEVLGLEQDAQTARLAQESGCRVIVADPQQANLAAEAEFDLITFWHALEHIPDVQGAISLADSKLKSDGILVIALPNPESWDARFYGARWAAWDAPRHLYHFRAQDLQRLVGQAAPGLVLTKRAALPLDPFYNALLSELSWRGGAVKFLFALRGLLIGICSFGFGILAGRGSSILYQFRKK